MTDAAPKAKTESAAFLILRALAGEVVALYLDDGRLDEVNARNDFLRECNRAFDAAKWRALK